MVIEGDDYRSSPDTQRYTNIWDWDHAIALAGYSHSDREFAAKSLFSTASDYEMHPWGRQITHTKQASRLEKDIIFPLLRGHPENRKVDAWTQPPVAGVCMQNTIENMDLYDVWENETQRREVVEQVITGLESRFTYLLENLTDPEDGLPITIHPYEDGTDGEPDSFLEMGLAPGDTKAFEARGAEIAFLNRTHGHDRRKILESLKNGYVNRPVWLKALGKVAPPVLKTIGSYHKARGKRESGQFWLDHANAVRRVEGAGAKLYAKKHVLFASAAAAGMDSVSKLNEMMGRIEQAEEWGSHAKTMWEKIFERMYDPETKTFGNLLSQTSEPPGEIVWYRSEYQTASGLTPLLCPHADLLEKYGVDINILDRAMDPKHFGGECGVNYIWNGHEDELNGGDEPLWLNTYYSWPPPNYLIWKACLTHGKTETAKKIAVSFTSAVEKHGAWEQHCGRTGEGRRTPDFSWTAAVYLEMQHWLSMQEV